MKKLLAILVLAFCLGGCTEQIRARKWGGNSTIRLPKGERLVMVTWKGADLWMMTEQRPEADPPKSYKFAESSSWGVMQGQINILEQ